MSGELSAAASMQIKARQIKARQIKARPQIQAGVDDLGRALAEWMQQRIGNSYILFRSRQVVVVRSGAR